MHSNLYNLRRNYLILSNFCPYTHGLIFFSLRWFKTRTENLRNSKDIKKSTDLLGSESIAFKDGSTFTWFEVAVLGINSFKPNISAKSTSPYALVPGSVLGNISSLI